MLQRYLLCVLLMFPALPAAAAEAIGSAARAVFTTQIKDREPVDALTTVKTMSAKFISSPNSRV